jgi:hypothetical protein
MENVKAELNSDQISLKLTDQKLFVKTIYSEEVFALRTINGVGIIDLVDDYNSALSIWKSKLKSLNIGIGLIWFILLAQTAFILITLLSSFVLLQEQSGSGFGVFILMDPILIPTLIILLIKKRRLNSQKPSLESSFRIYLMGDNRDFKFNKSNQLAGDVANIAARIEDTLTAFHKSS